MMGRKPGGNRTKERKRTQVKPKRGLRKNERKREARENATDAMFEPKAPGEGMVKAKEGEALRAFVGTVPDEDIRSYAIELARVAAMGVGILRFIENKGTTDPALLDYTDRLLWQPLKVAPNVQSAIYLGLRDIAVWFEEGLPQGVVKEEGMETHAEGQPEVPPASDQSSTEETIHAVDERRAAEEEEVADVGQEWDGEE